MVRIVADKRKALDCVVGPVEGIAKLCGEEKEEKGVDKDLKDDKSMAKPIASWSLPR